MPKQHEPAEAAVQAVQQPGLRPRPGPADAPVQVGDRRGPAARRQRQSWGGRLAGRADVCGDVRERDGRERGGRAPGRAGLQRARGPPRVLQVLREEDLVLREVHRRPGPAERLQHRVGEPLHIRHPLCGRQDQDARVAQGGDPYRRSSRSCRRGASPRSRGRGQGRGRGHGRQAHEREPDVRGGGAASRAGAPHVGPRDQARPAEDHRADGIAAAAREHHRREGFPRPLPAGDARRDRREHVHEAGVIRSRPWQC
mmetsp:Transcript_66449/g.187200  ORF Transcript_66449/g.187200 Transcript_66449/m.187200 type:complete len:256 (+) Transcript_66449:1884-2651(+)